MKTGINVEISEGIATITFNRPESLNAFMAEGLPPFMFIMTHFHVLTLRVDYNDFAVALHAINKREDVYVTIWQGRLDPLNIDQYVRGTHNMGSYGSLLLRVSACSS